MQSERKVGRVVVVARVVMVSRLIVFSVCIGAVLILGMEIGVIVSLSGLDWNDSCRAVLKFNDQSELVSCAVIIDIQQMNALDNIGIDFIHFIVIFILL